MIEKADMVDNVLLVVAAARYASAVPAPRVIRSVGRGVVEPPVAAARETVLRARPVRNVQARPVFDERLALDERRALAARATDASRGLPRYVANAYRPAPADAQGARVDLYV
jgi:hypothetical protein